MGFEQKNIAESRINELRNSAKMHCSFQNDIVSKIEEFEQEFEHCFMGIS
jgi:hypothetical protein